MPYLKWVEPWGGYKIPNDTGFCNRIFHWEFAYEVNKRNNFEFNILLQEHFWPEYKYIDLPYTEMYNHDIHKPTNTNIPLFEPDYLPDNSINNIIRYTNPFSSWDIKENNFELDTQYDWYPTCGFNFVRDIEKNYKYHRPLQLIKLRNKELDKLIKDKASDLVGVHIRRGEGTKPFTPDAPMKAIDNELYFKIMDAILEENPNQKFYISCDVPLENIKVFFEKYDCITYKNLELKKYHQKEKFKKLHRFTLQNIVDLFMLANAKFLITVNKSTWSSFANLYNKRLFVELFDADYDIYTCHDPIDMNDIIDLYKRSCMGHTSDELRIFKNTKATRKAQEMGKERRKEDIYS